jgi:hypothetical protein
MTPVGHIHWGLTSSEGETESSALAQPADQTRQRIAAPTTRGIESGPSGRFWFLSRVVSRRRAKAHH